MSHDRGCSCGREKYEYHLCTERNCVHRVVPQPDCFHMENDETPTKPSKQTVEQEAYHAPWYEHFKIQPLDFCVQNELDVRQHAVIKYICRYKYKGQALKDLYQARFYIDHIIKELENV